MRYEFTAGAQRALDAAAGWTSGDDLDDLHAPELLLGLLAEPECRAALALAECGVDRAAVERQWPGLRLVERTAPGRAGRLGSEVSEAVSLARTRLFEHPQPLTLATEHLLLGLVASEGEVGQWLRAAGLDPDRLETLVHQWAGHVPGPLDVDWEWESGESSEKPGEGTVVEPAIVPPAPATGAAARNAAGAAVGGPVEGLPLAALRILDAAANRAAEGLRVVEDYLRFALDDRHLTERAKSLRHRLAGLLSRLPAEERHAARDTAGDVGTQITTEGEAARASMADVAAAGFQRAEQALRSLEEFGKLFAAELAAGMKALRYETYTLERAASMTRASLRRLAHARLYVLLDGRATQGEFVRMVETLVAAGVDVVQLRDKRLADRELLVRARRLVALTRGTSTLAIVNDRPDLAALARADGVHVGQEELTVKDCRAIVGPRRLIGVSTHDIAQARRAVLEGADYLGVGPTFPSRTKQFADFPGLDFVRAAAAEIRLPTFAIGGITAENAGQVIAAGLGRVAVSSNVVDAADPAAAARRLRAVLSAAEAK